MGTNPRERGRRRGKTKKKNLVAGRSTPTPPAVVAETRHVIIPRIRVPPVMVSVIVSESRDVGVVLVIAIGIEGLALRTVIPILIGIRSGWSGLFRRASGKRSEQRCGHHQADMPRFFHLISLLKRSMYNDPESDHHTGGEDSCRHIFLLDNFLVQVTWGKLVEEPKTQRHQNHAENRIERGHRKARPKIRDHCER